MDWSKYGYRKDYDPESNVVKQENITVEGKEYYVSTVDLGLDHRYGDGPPLYFETMIFPEGEWGELYCNRYTDRETALIEHEKLIEGIKSNRYRIIDGCFEEVQNG